MGNSGLSAQMWLMIVAVLLLSSILILMITKNNKVVYLKPKSGTDNNSSNNMPADSSMASYPETQANQNTEVRRSELQSLRQQAVSMSVSEKSGSNQIVKDWLDDKVDEGEDEENTTNEE